MGREFREGEDLERDLRQIEYRLMGNMDSKLNVGLRTRMTESMIAIRLFGYIALL